MKNNRYEKEKFSKIVEKSNNLSDVAKKLGLTSGHGNRQTIKKYIDLYNINIDHFIFSSGNVKNFEKNDLNDILIENSHYGTTHLKNRLFKEGVKEKKCEICGQEEMWFNKKLTFILDHKNGIRTDHRLENLRILCPNCNSVLDTNCGKNLSKYKKTNNNFCECGKKISKNSKNCTICFSNKHSKDKPDLKILVESVEKIGYRATGRKYNVSNNTIKRWLKNAGIV